MTVDDAAWVDVHQKSRECTGEGGRARHTRVHSPHTFGHGGAHALGARCDKCSVGRVWSIRKGCTIPQTFKRGKQSSQLNDGQFASSKVAFFDKPEVAHLGNTQIEQFLHDNFNLLFVNTSDDNGTDSLRYWPWRDKKNTKNA